MDLAFASLLFSALCVLFYHVMRMGYGKRIIHGLQATGSETPAMQNALSLSAVGHATSLLFAISFLVCVGFNLLVPQYAMYEHWQSFLPGFVWLSPGAFFLGLVESYAYGWYLALVWVPLHNVFPRRAARFSERRLA